MIIREKNNVNRVLSMTACGLSVAIFGIAACSSDDSNDDVFEENVDLSTLSVDDGERACRLFENRFASSETELSSKLCRAFYASETSTGEITETTCQTKVEACEQNGTEFNDIIKQFEEKTDCDDRIIQRSFRTTLLECPQGQTTGDLTECLDRIADQADRAEQALACESSQYEVAAVLSPILPGVCKSLIDACPGVNNLISRYQDDVLSVLQRLSGEEADAIETSEAPAEDTDETVGEAVDETANTRRRHD